MADAVRNATAETLRQVQTERVCPQCGYILRGQNVLRHAPTGLWTVRCPECATVTPVNHLGEGDPHRPRLTFGLGLGWTFLGLLVGLMTANLGVLALIVLVKLDYQWAPMRGRGMVRSVVLDGSATLEAMLGPEGWVFVGLTFVLAVVMGLWVYRRPWPLRVAAAILPPVLGALLTMQTPMFRWSAGQGVLGLVLGWTGVQVLAAAGGALVCRPMGRAIVRALLPNAARLAFEPLWQIDGQLVPLGRW